MMRLLLLVFATLLLCVARGVAGTTSLSSMRTLTLSSRFVAPDKRDHGSSSAAEDAHAADAMFPRPVSNSERIRRLALRGERPPPPPAPPAPPAESMFDASDPGGVRGRYHHNEHATRPQSHPHNPGSLPAAVTAVTAGHHATAAAGVAQALPGEHGSSSLLKGAPRFVSSRRELPKEAGINYLRARPPKIPPHVLPGLLPKGEEEQLPSNRYVYYRSDMDENSPLYIPPRTRYKWMLMPLTRDQVGIPVGQTDYAIQQDSQDKPADYWPNPIQIPSACSRENCSKNERRPSKPHFVIDILFVCRADRAHLQQTRWRSLVH